MSDERKQEQQRKRAEMSEKYFIIGADGVRYEAVYDLPLPSEEGDGEKLKAALCGPYGRFFNEGTD